VEYAFARRWEPWKWRGNEGPVTIPDFEARNEALSRQFERRGSVALEGFEFVEGAGPVGAEEAGEATIGEDFAAGLAMGAVVGLVVGVADALDGLAATGAGLAKAAMDRHFRAEGGDFFREALLGFSAETVDPESEGGAGGGEEAVPVFGLEFGSEREGRELGGVEDFVGVGVADTADEAGIGESALEGAVFSREGGAEAGEVRGEDFDAAGIEVVKGLLAADEMERSAALGAGFREDERTGGEIEGGEGVASGEFGLGRAPVETAGDHEVKNQPEIAFNTDGDALADAAEGADGFAFNAGEGRIDGAEKEDGAEAHTVEGLGEDEGFESGDVGGDVGEFRHG
jgi:hypothetical protein